MKYLPLVCLILVGCNHIADSGTPEHAAKAVPPKTMDQKLYGTWSLKTVSGETSVTYTKDHHYSTKSGRLGFSTGFYFETGTWDIYLGDRLELNPMDRKSTVKPSDKELTAEIKSSEKAMDEGAWKPMPEKVAFLNDNAYSTAIGTDGKPITYRRAP